MRSIRTYLKLALLCTVLSGFVGCSNNDDIVPENKNEKCYRGTPTRLCCLPREQNVRWREIHGRSTRVCLHTARRQMGARP